jgi:L,D-peptidoglycan transpeptidase YkuD (ErfK/YbiS/YcfS/YnhG family)
MRMLCLPVCAALALAATASAAPRAAGCAAGPANGLVAVGGATQLITVKTASERSTVAALRLWERRGDCWTPVSSAWRAHLGFNGVSAAKREGDGTTPAGVFRIGPVVYGIAADPGTQLAYHRVVCGDWWDEDPGSPAYNTFRHVPCGARRPFAAESEGLWKARLAYRHFAVVEYNAHPVVAGRGSAIFLHVDTGGPTNGCVSLPPAELDHILRWLRPSPAALIAIGTAPQLRRF